MRLKYNTVVGARAALRAGHYAGLSEVRFGQGPVPGQELTRDAIADEFEVELLRGGWHGSWPGNTAFVENVWKFAYQGHAELSLVKKLLAPSPLLSFARAAEEGWTSQEPSVGAIGVLKNGATDGGHCFVVMHVAGERLLIAETDFVHPLDGVGDDDAAQWVHRRMYEVVYKPTSQLHLVGFIVPCAYD